MLRTTLAGLRLHKGRLVTTGLAIALGVMFVAGTLVFSGTLREAFSAQVMGSADRFAAIAQADPEAAPAADPEEGEPERAALDQGLLDEVRGLDEVAEAGAVSRGDAALLDTEGRAVGSTSTAGLGLEGTTRYTASEGELPSGPDETALATTSAETAGHEVGDTVEVISADGTTRSYEVTGLVDFGTDRELAYRGAVVFDSATAREVAAAEGWHEIDVRTADGVTDEQAVTAIEEAAGPAAVVETGTELGEKLAEASGTEANMFAVALMMFAMVALFVAGIVIYNTFAILIAQRQREMALLRCVGADRGQVFRSVLAEAVIVGLVSSALGVLAGVGIGWAGFRFGSAALDADGSAPLVVGVLPIAVGMTVGLVMTLVAALVPALRATRVPPLAALRTSATAQGMEKGIGWLRITGAGVFFLASAALVALSRALAPETNGLMVAVVSAIVAFVGVVILSPLLVRTVVAAVSPLMRRLSVPSMLAADNSRRNPHRAATAMIALTVGATLITGYAVVNASLQETLNHQLDEQFPVDYQVSAPFDDPDAVVPASVAEKLNADPAIDRVMETHRAFPDTGGAAVETYDGAVLGEDVGGDPVSGDLADVGQGSVAVSEDYVEGRSVGDEMPVATEDGERNYEIAAITASSGGLMDITMTPEDFTTAFPGVEGASSMGILGVDGVSSEELRDAVYTAVEDDPLLQVSSTTEMRNQFDSMLSIAFVAIAAMLGLAILIAVFGIANTMALSVLERTRESALLRALGLGRGQLRRMLSIEAVLLCLIGAGVGIALGIVFGWVTSASVMPDMVFSLPIGQIAVFVAVAVAAGLLASVLPGRKAAGTSISGALASD